MARLWLSFVCIDLRKKSMNEDRRLRERAIVSGSREGERRGVAGVEDG